MSEPRCPRCGAELKIEKVKVPVRGEPIIHDIEDGGGMESGEIIRYEEREEVSDCPRCHGAY